MGFIWVVQNPLASSFSFLNAKKIQISWDTSILGMDDEALMGAF
jgi:hypothetical protein